MPTIWTTDVPQFFAPTDRTACVECLSALDELATSIGGKCLDVDPPIFIAIFDTSLAALNAAWKSRSLISDFIEGGGQQARHLLFEGQSSATNNGVDLPALEHVKAGAIELTKSVFTSVLPHTPFSFDDVETAAAPRFRLRSSILKFAQDRRKINLIAVNPIRPCAIAVEPFSAVASTDKDNGHIAAGLWEDTIFELARFRELHVVAPAACALIAGESAAQVGSRLGVSYVLSGSVRSSDDQLAQKLWLTRCETGEIVWSERTSLELATLADSQQETAARVANIVAGRITQTDIKVTRGKHPNNMSAYEYFLRGLENHRLSGLTYRNARDAMSWFERAFTSDPSYARAYAMYACSWANLPDFDPDKAEEMVTKAAKLTPQDPQVQRVIGAMYLVKKDYEAARRHHELAMQAAPNDTYILGRSAAFYNFYGMHDHALKLLERARELDPLLPVNVVEETCAINFVLGNYDDVIAQAQTMTILTRRTRLYTAVSFVKLKNMEAARLQIDAADAEGETLDEAFIRTAEIYRNTGITDELVRLVGLVDGSIPTADPAKPDAARRVKRNIYGLTRRQLDVLALINQGLTNIEIGERLFVSPKTVDHHVSAILARLEVSSRGQAASMARQESLV